MISKLISTLAGCAVIGGIGGAVVASMKMPLPRGSTTDQTNSQLKDRVPVGVPKAARRLTGSDLEIILPRHAIVPIGINPDHLTIKFLTYQRWCIFEAGIVAITRCGKYDISPDGTITASYRYPESKLHVLVYVMYRDRAHYYLTQISDPADGRGLENSRIVRLIPLGGH